VVDAVADPVSVPHPAAIDRTLSLPFSSRAAPNDVIEDMPFEFDVHGIVGASKDG
jgi:hypothetical protein